MEKDDFMHYTLLPLEVKGISKLTEVKGICNLTEIGFRSSDYLDVLSELIKQQFLKKQTGIILKNVSYQKIDCKAVSKVQEE